MKEIHRPTAATGSSYGIAKVESDLETQVDNTTNS